MNCMELDMLGIKIVIRKVIRRITSIYYHRFIQRTELPKLQLTFTKTLSNGSTSRFLRSNKINISNFASKTGSTTSNMDFDYDTYEHRITKIVYEVRHLKAERGKRMPSQVRLEYVLAR